MSNELDQFTIDDDLFDEFNEETHPKKKESSRFCKAKKVKQIKFLKYKNAEKLARDINFNTLDRIFCVVDGSFIFGDFIEAFFIENNIKSPNLIIETLSMSQDNVDSLRTLLEKGYIDSIDLIVSDYFYSHERNNLIKYMYNELDINDSFQLSVCRTHRKICKFATTGGKYIMITGSANLRSSDNMESFCIEDNEEFYNFDKSITDEIITRYKTINKSIKSKELWHLVAKNTQE